MISRKEITEAYINIGTMFGNKPTKELIKRIPKKDLVDVCYRLYEIIEEQEKIIYEEIKNGNNNINNTNITISSNELYSNKVKTGMEDTK